MTTYRVIHTIQSTDTSNPPVEVPYYDGPDLAVALVAAGQAATSRDLGYVTSLSVRLDFIPEPASTWNFEAGAALDDCIYWPSGKKCAGPRVGVRSDDGVVVCEKHINEPS